MSAYRPFKATERAIARIVGGQRTGHLGGADVQTAGLCVEVKHRAAMPAWLRAAVAQAERNATAEQLPVAVLREHGGRHDTDLVVMTLATFRALTGD